MSVFYNLSKNATNSKSQDARFEAFGGDGAVVKNPSDYSVGVNRFKIPLGTIPIYRIYDKEFNYGTHMNGQSTINSLGVKKGRADLALIRTNMYDGSQIFASYGKYGIDSRNENKKYKDVFSQEDFVEQLNQAQVRSLSNLIPTGGSLINGSNFSHTNTTEILLYDPNTGSNTGEAQVLTFQVPANTPSTKLNNTGSIIIGIDVKIQTILPATGLATTSIDFSDYDFYLTRTSNVAGLTDTNTFPLIISQLEGDGGWDGSTNLNHQVSWGSTEKHHIGSSQNRDTTLINAYRNQSNSNLPFHVYMEDTNMEGIMGKRYDGYDYVITCKNKTQLNMGIAPRVAKIPATDFVLEFKTLNLSGISNRVFTQPSPPLRQNSMLIPYWTLDSNEKLSYNINSTYILGFQMKLYMNDALFNLISFNEYKTKDITQSNLSLVMTDNTNIYSQNDDGVSLSFDGNIEKRIVNGRIQLGDTLEYKEAYKTTFARDFLNGIIITTGSIAIDGEIIADGDSKRRILTDFVIDPSSVGRDYLVFSNQGGMRLYSVKSTEPLRRIDVQVSYQDIYGKVRPLLIKPSQELNIKLEFRPNNQIYNMDNSYSVFQN